MKQIAVVYWSGTGNTEAMAGMVAQGAQDAGAKASLIRASEFDASMMDPYDALAFGCPAMGSETLEDGEFEPMFERCRAKLSGRTIGLFGSYGWGDGEWMQNWAEACVADGAVLAADPVICCGAPDEEAARACTALGAAFL